MMRFSVPLLLLLFHTATFGQGSIVASFSAPDTVCVRNPVNIVNTTSGASSWFWNFCVGNLNNPPVGTNLGNIGNAMTSPAYIDYVEDNGQYYGFVTDNHTGKLFQYHGHYCYS